MALLHRATLAKYCISEKYLEAIFLSQRFRDGSCLFKEIDIYIRVQDLEIYIN